LDDDEIVVLVFGLTVVDEFVGNEVFKTVACVLFGKIDEL
jgi:hypothetical protein